MAIRPVDKIIQNISIHAGANSSVTLPLQLQPYGVIHKLAVKQKSGTEIAFTAELLSKNPDGSPTIDPELTYITPKLTGNAGQVGLMLSEHGYVFRAYNEDSRTIYLRITQSGTSAGENVWDAVITWRSVEQ